jgi:polyisoprenoid-binding protein YceI
MTQSILSRAVPVLLLALALGCGEDHTEGVTAATVSSAPAEPTAAPEPSAARTTLAIDPATSTLGFTGAKVTGSHDGTFTRFSGNIELDTANVTASSVNVSIEIASMTIEPARLAEHLLTADFFDAPTHPTATFASSSVTAGGTGTVGDVPVTHTITGDLTLHGQTHRITFPAVIEVDGSTVRARAEFTINRRDFGIEYPGMPDDLIRDEVVIRFDVRAHS